MSCKPVKINPYPSCNPLNNTQLNRLDGISKLYTDYHVCGLKEEIKIQIGNIDIDDHQNEFDQIFQFIYNQQSFNEYIFGQFNDLKEVVK